MSKGLEVVVGVALVTATTVMLAGVVGSVVMMPKIAKEFKRFDKEFEERKTRIDEFKRHRELSRI